MADRLSLETITDRETSSDAAAELNRLDRLRIKIGGWTVGAIISLIVVVLALVAAYAVATIPPELAEIHELEGKAGALEKYRQLRREWFGEIKDLLQLLVVSLLIPLVTTVIGYIFGRQADASTKRA
jgi:ABC-type spermidine/putrescine transport system permease subunit I